jgi:hypothetical protein
MILRTIKTATAITNDANLPLGVSNVVDRVHVESESLHPNGREQR